jgi:hypothetical protein
MYHTLYRTHQENHELYIKKDPAEKLGLLEEGLN